MLGLALIGEVVALLIFDLVVFGQGGDNIQAGAINPINAFKSLPACGSGDERRRRGRLGGGRVLRVLVVGRIRDGAELRRGVEGSEEDRADGRCTSRSIGLGIFYTITSWAALSSYPSPTAAAPRGGEQPVGFFLAPAKEFGNQFLSDVMSYLIITGSFACGMAFHNTAARYLYSLGREGCCRRRWAARTRGTRARTSPRSPSR